MADNDSVDRAANTRLVKLVLEAAHALRNRAVLLGLNRGVPMECQCMQGRWMA